MYYLKNSSLSLSSNSVVIYDRVFSILGMITEKENTLDAHYHYLKHPISPKNALIFKNIVARISNFSLHFYSCYPKLLLYKIIYNKISVVRNNVFVCFAVALQPLSTGMAS